MNNVIKAARLDFCLIRSYLKYMLLYMAVTLIFTAGYKSIQLGASFTMFFTAMSAAAAFSVTEKCGMERMYGILPVSAKHLVFGRYLYTFLIGLAGMVFFIIVHPLVLRAVGVDVPPEELFTAAMVGAVMFTACTIFQLPGYYKFGSIKGRYFSIIPYAFLFSVLGVSSKLGAINSFVTTAISVDPAILAAAVLLLCVAAYLISAAVSVRILRNKDA